MEEGVTEATQEDRLGPYCDSGKLWGGGTQLESPQVPLPLTLDHIPLREVAMLVHPQGNEVIWKQKTGDTWPRTEEVPKSSQSGWCPGRAMGSKEKRKRTTNRF